MARSLFTSESVSMGHPDKVADQISDAILDAFLAQDPKSRVACETLCTTGQVVVAGEITSKGVIDATEVVRRTIREIGYNDASAGFEAGSCGILVAIHKQSPDIAMGVNEGKEKEQGAGDQGMMFGYACDETPELMPLPILLAHRLVEAQAKMRESGKFKYLRPDAKSQVTIEYEDNQPVGIHTVVISTQHTPDADMKVIKRDMIKMATEVINKTSKVKVDKKTIFHINPTGRFEVGGPHGDTGLTGRKIIVDTYGGMGRHGGGAFSGKDPSKVDRSAAYFARYVAKNVVAAGLARRCEVQVAYAIGVARPVSVKVDTFGTSTACCEEALERAVLEVFDFRPKAIIQTLDLLKPIYRHTAYHGHFGRKQFTWERTDKVAALQKAAKRMQADCCGGEQSRCSTGCCCTK